MIDRFFATSNNGNVCIMRLYLSPFYSFDLTSMSFSELP